MRRLLQISPSPQDWFECRTLPRGATYLRWARLFEFHISADGRTIEYRRLQRATNESLTTYLLGQVLSFPLLTRGFEPLHATAVVVDGEAVAFLGDCGYGKSTLGAAFLARGYPVLTDDVLALEARRGRWWAHPGPARLKLFPSVAEKVLHRSNGRLMNPDTSKVVLPLSADQAAAQAAPVKALYVLPDPSSAARIPRTGVRVTDLAGQQAFLEVIRSAFNLIQVDRARLENQFYMATRLVRDVPVKRLSYRRGLSSIDTVCDAVLADSRRPSAPGSARRS